jgi:hypothetical protein
MRLPFFNMNAVGECGPAETLNERCFCASLDRRALASRLQAQLTALAPGELHEAIRTDFFADVPLFVRRADMATMEQAVRSIDALARDPRYASAVSAWMPPIARHDFGPLGVFMGYDFHLTEAGPRLIEINTNAGGAFLNAELARAQRACCPEVEQALHSMSELQSFEASVVEMFESEWCRQRGAGQPKRIAIVDDEPEAQPFYPEFRLAQSLLAARGMDVSIAGPERLALSGDALLLDGRSVDIVYNRLVDFSLADARHAVLREAYLRGGVVLTPNPRIHALFADKRNLVVLSDADALARIGADETNAALLSTIVPKTTFVTPRDAEDLWRSRRQLFFKPVSGYGSKGVYRGSGVTRTVFARILEGGYIAQRYVPPSERLIKVGGQAQPLKVDVRLYTYGGKVLLTAARMYRGQATNMRTPGGGFAPVFQV